MERLILPMAFKNLAVYSKGQHIVYDGSKTFSDFYGDNLKKIATASEIIWKCGTTFRHACDISTLYIQGILVSSPNYPGPFSSESFIIENLTICTRNGLLVTFSNPARQIDVDRLDGWESSVEFWIQSHNVPFLTKTLDNYYIKDIERKDVQPSYTFFDAFGSNYDISNVECYIVKCTGHDVDNANGLFEVLAEASKTFTDKPIETLDEETATCSEDEL